MKTFIFFRKHANAHWEIGFKSAPKIVAFLVHICKQFPSLKSSFGLFKIFQFTFFILKEITKDNLTINAKRICCKLHNSMFFFMKLSLINFNMNFGSLEIFLEYLQETHVN